MRDPGSLFLLVLVNANIRAVSLIGLAFMTQRCPGAKGLFPILAGGAAVGSLLVSVIWRQRRPGPSGPSR